MSNDKVVKFTSKQESSVAEALSSVQEYIEENPLDTVIIVGLKGDRAIMAHSSFNSIVEMLGKLELASFAIDETKLNYMYGEE